MNALDNAFKFAEELGFKVFPIWKNGKNPLVKGGFKVASSDPDQIQAWASQYPECNWAVATGYESGVLVVDIDSPEADQWWENQWLPSSAEVRTPRGGRHIYYAYDGEKRDISISQGLVHEGIDIRANGGYALLPGSSTSSSTDVHYGNGTYEGDFSDMIELPDSVAELIPQRQEYVTIAEDSEELQGVEKPGVASEAEKRVLQGCVDRLLALPVPWVPGAGYHSTQFSVACHLWRIARSPFYAATEAEVRQLFMDNAPVREDATQDHQSKRWADARKQTEGQVAEHPGDVPIRLDADATLGKFPGSRIENLFWSSVRVGEVKELISELRMAGATEQEAYSVSYEANAMKLIRKRSGQGSSASTWGWVQSAYESDHSAPEEADSDWDNVTQEPVVDRVRTETRPHPLLSEAERAVLRDFPNFIDRYVETAREIYAEPNLPLHYMNAWAALSAMCADKALLVLKSGRTPLALWTMSAADSAAGKGDAKSFLKDVVDRGRLGGFADVNIGSSASAEALNSNIMEREGEMALFFSDECAKTLRGFKDPRSWESRARDLMLDLYDGSATTALRSGTKTEDVGKTVNVTYGMWLQTTWENFSTIMDHEEISTGFIGRFLIAIGDEAKVTRESLSIEVASEYQVSIGGVHPLAASLGDGVKYRIGGNRATTAIKIGWRVSERYADMAEAIQEVMNSHPLAKDMRGIGFRIAKNIFKAAALHAISEGRFEVVMTDLLLAIKSGEYWLRDTLKMTDAISASEYRRKVNTLIEFIYVRPRTRAQIIGPNGPFKNISFREAQEIIERAEAEGAIEKIKDTDKWQTKS